MDFYIKEDIDRVGPAEHNSLETELMEMQPEYDRMYSRLACQVILTPKHNLYFLIFQLQSSEDIKYIV